MLHTENLLRGLIRQIANSAVYLAIFWTRDFRMNKLARASRAEQVGGRGGGGGGVVSTNSNVRLTLTQ